MALNPLGGPELKVPLVQPVITPAQFPYQTDVADNIEAKDSRRQREDLQRGTIVMTYILLGLPDQVARDQATGGVKIGFPHPFEKDMFVVHVQLDHWIFGADSEGSELTPTAQRDNRPYTKMTVTYKQVPCPGAYIEEESISLMSRVEWWDRRNIRPRSLRGTREGMSILYPVPVLKRHFPKVFLNPVDRGILRSLAGSTNGVNFLTTDDVGTWMFVGAQTRLLYGDPLVDKSAWEVTLIFRQDIERHHEWWFPKLNRQRLVPEEEIDAGEAARRAAHDTRSIYPISETDFNDLVPFRGTPCDPPGETV